MSRIKRGRPSPAIVIAVLALVAALAGTAVAGPDATTSAPSKAKVKQIATKKAKQQIKKNTPWGPSDIENGAIRSSKLGPIAVRTSSTTIPAAAPFVGTATASCQSGEKLLGGGGRFDGGPIAAIATATQVNYPTDNGWRAGGVNGSGTPQQYTAYAVCLEDNSNG